jgi:hypothetical protein
MKLAASLRYSLYGTLAALFASGTAWLATRYGARAPFGDSRWSAVSMQVHGAAAMALLVLAGGAIALHVGSAWRERRNRVSGLAVGIALLAMTVTGYLLYYAGEDSERAIASVAHWVVGLAAPLVVAWHTRVK